MDETNKDIDDLFTDRSKQEDVEVGNLVKNISEGLEVLSLPELNEAIASVVRKQRQKQISMPKNVDRLFEVVCSEFRISKQALFEKYSRGQLYQAKITMYAIMHNALGISRRSISKIFNSYPNSINVGVKYYTNLNPEKIKSDKDFLIKYHKCLSTFLQKIKK